MIFVPKIYVAIVARINPFEAIKTSEDVLE